MKHKPTTIVLTGGGSGGHITPLLPIAQELKHRNSSIKIVYIGQKGDSLGYLTDKNNNFDSIKLIHAGKFRRYPNRTVIRNLTDYRTMLFNLRDLFFVKLGLLESLVYFILNRPSVIFVKGGYVGLPVGLAAWLLKIPFITHDSDAIPGLTNRIIGRFAKFNATGMQTEFYGYPKSKARFVGIPLDKRHQVDSDNQVEQYRKQLNLPKDSQLLLVTGGGNGSKTVNELCISISRDLLSKYPNLYIFHLAGIDLAEGVENGYRESLTKELMGRVKVFGYSQDMPIMSSVADLIITRAGASTLAGFAVQGKACLVIPNPYLTGGHQVKNAQKLLEKDAIELITDDATAEQLSLKVIDLLGNPKRLKQLGQNLQATSKPDAEKQISDLLFDLIKQN